jgi:hypothetical protein
MRVLEDVHSTKSLPADALKRFDLTSLIKDALSQVLNFAIRKQHGATFVFCPESTDALSEHMRIAYKTVGPAVDELIIEYLSQPDDRRAEARFRDGVRLIAQASSVDGCVCIWPAPQKLVQKL